MGDVKAGRLHLTHLGNRSVQAGDLSAFDSQPFDFLSRISHFRQPRPSSPETPLSVAGGAVSTAGSGVSSAGEIVSSVGTCVYGSGSTVSSSGTGV